LKIDKLLRRYRSSVISLVAEARNPPQKELRSDELSILC
jgi:hypothetical protein